MQRYFSYISDGTYIVHCRCAGGLKKFDLRSGSHAVPWTFRRVFFNMPVQAPRRGQPFYGYSEKPSHLSCFLRHAWGYGGQIIYLIPGSPRGFPCLIRFQVDVAQSTLSDVQIRNHYTIYFWIYYIINLAVFVPGFYYDLSAWHGRWYSVSKRRITYKF